MRYVRTSEQLQALGIAPSAPPVLSQRERYATPQKGELEEKPQGRLARKAPRFYHRLLKRGHQPHWYRLEAFDQAFPNGELARKGKRGNVVGVCEPAGCGNIRMLHPFKAGEPSTPASTRGLLKAVPPKIGPMRSETAVAWKQATGRAS